MPMNAPRSCRDVLVPEWKRGGGKGTYALGCLLEVVIPNGDGY